MTALANVEKFFASSVPSVGTAVNVSRRLIGGDSKILSLNVKRPDLRCRGGPSYDGTAFERIVGRLRRILGSSSIMILPSCYKCFSVSDLWYSLHILWFNS